MPELPEVECLTQAVRSVLQGGVFLRAEFFRRDLREPIPIKEFRRLLEGRVVEDVFRRSKYLLMKTNLGYGIFHLGVIGHTHAVFAFREPSGRERFLHFVDPRRFGRIDCLPGDSYEQHAYFAHLGPEPLVHRRLGHHLYEESRKRRIPVKVFVMDASIVVGVGNIYASEALYRAGLDPRRAAGTFSLAEYQILAKSIRATLRASIASGGTTFRDFRNSDGNPGYFAVKLNVYDRAGQPCLGCSATIQTERQGGRSTFFCAVCQN